MIRAVFDTNIVVSSVLVAMEPKLMCSTSPPPKQFNSM